MIVRLVDLDRFDNPFEIVNAIFGTGHQAVTQKVIHSVDIELRRDELGERTGTKIAANGRGNIVRKTRRKSFEQLSNLGLVAQNRFDRKLLVMKIKDRLDDMRKRPVADVV